MASVVDAGLDAEGSGRARVIAEDGFERVERPGLKTVWRQMGSELLDRVWREAEVDGEFLEALVNSQLLVDVGVQSYQ